MGLDTAGELANHDSPGAIASTAALDATPGGIGAAVEEVGLKGAARVGLNESYVGVSGGITVGSYYQGGRDMATGVIVAGVFFLIIGIVLIVTRSATAKANDTRGPDWVRNANGQAYPGRTTPRKVLGLGVLVSVMGVFLVVLSILYSRGLISRS